MMQPSTSLAISKIKVRVPFRRQELITRTRLLETLTNQLNRRLLLVVAPAGYGKTSLLVDVAQQSKNPVCWFAIDPLDREPQRFVRYLIAAIAEQFPEFGQEALMALESMTSFDGDEERLLVTLANEIISKINVPFHLILDDYHLVGDMPFAGLIISRLLQLTDEHLHLILASRNIPDLADVPLLIARGQFGGVTFQDLAFQPQEIQQLFLHNSGLSLELADARALVEQTEGWIAAIHLTNGHPAGLPRMHPLESTRELFDFFSSEVLRRQSRQVYRFLLMTSIFDVFDVGLCEQVLTPLVGDEKYDWGQLFEVVRTGNLFSVGLDRDGRLIRYHQLFQYFLRAQLQYEDPVLAWHLHQRLGEVYEAREEWEEALQVYDRQGAHEQQARLLIRISSIFLRSGQILTLSHWLEKLPEEVVQKTPGLIALRGVICSTRGENSRALELYNRAEGELRISDDVAAWTTTLVRRAEVLRQLGEFKQALRDVDQTLVLTQDSENLELQQTFAEAQRIRGLASYGLGNMQDALTWLQRALKTSQALGLQRNIPILEAELGVVYRKLGQPEVTARYYASALAAWRSAGNTGWRANLLNNMGLLCHMTGRLNEAREYLSEALQIAEQSGYVTIQTTVLISLGDLLADLSEKISAYDHYDRALTLATNLGNSLLIFYAQLGEARMQRLTGEVSLAIEELKHAELSQVSLGTFERALFNLELGCCWLAMDKPEVSMGFLRAAEELFEQGGNLMEQKIARLWLEIVRALQNSKITPDNLKSILPPVHEWRLATPFMLHAAQAVTQLRAKGQSGLLADPVLGKFFAQAAEHQRLLTRSQEPSVLASVDTQKPRLEITSFGEVVVRFNQRILKTADWQTRESRDFFMFLLHSPPQTKEQIALEFWPDISPARLKMRFKINVYRVRKALGQDAVLFEADRYRFNRTLSYTWDREVLDQLLNTIPATIGPHHLDPLQRAIDILRKPYLADLDADWAVSDRLRYQDLYRDLLVRLADGFLQANQPQSCLDSAREALRQDPLLETAHRLIIQAYATLHDPAGMTLQFRQYQQLMMSELGLGPSAEISLLYERLLDTL